MNILLIGNPNSTFCSEYATEILCSVPNASVSLFSMIPESSVREEIKNSLREHAIQLYYTKEKRIKRKKLINITIILRNLYEMRICKTYDTIQIHSISPAHWSIAYFANSKANVIMSYYGSDLLRSNPIKITLQRILANRANHITVATQYMKECFSTRVGEKYIDKVCKIGYGKKGVELIESIIDKSSKMECKRSFGAAPSKTVVLCGYNGNCDQRHTDILTELSKLSMERKNRLFILCHFGYAGTKEYEQKVENALIQSGIEGKIVSDYYGIKDITRLRMATDIMINIQKSDALSASVMESIAAGAQIIKGDWLHYPELEEYEQYISDITDTSKLGKRIFEIIDEMPNEITSNMRHRILFELLSWDAKKDTWHKIIAAGKIDN